MATGDSDDVLRRLRSLIPAGWFSDTAPIRDVVLGGIGDTLSWCYGLLASVRLQQRLASASGWLLDLKAWDFFGPNFLRRTGELDDPWRARIKAEIFRPRVTRDAIRLALLDLTGVEPKIIEPWNANDCGAYDLGGIAYAGSDFVQSPSGGYDISGAYDIGRTGYDVLVGATGNTSAGMGCWGSLEVPYQLFVTAFRPLGGGIPNASGTDYGVQGYDIGAFRYVDQADVNSPVSDADIYAAVAATEPAGVIAWTAIQDAPQAPTTTTTEGDQAGALLLLL